MISSSAALFNFANAWVVDYLGWIIGVLGIIVTILIAVWTRKRRLPSYCSQTTRLIQDSVNQIDGLTIYYDSIKLNALSISKVAFWNAGRDTISNSDISGQDKLRVEINNDYDILSCDVLTQTKKANNFSVELAEDRKSVLISFDYIDYEDGTVLKIRHTGSSNSDIVIKGSVKAVKEIKRNVPKYYFTLVEKEEFRITKRMRWVFFLLSILFLVSGIVLTFSSLLFDMTQFVDAEGELGLFYYVFMVVYIIMGYVFFMMFKDYLGSYLPKSLVKDYFNEDF